ITLLGTFGNSIPLCLSPRTIECNWPPLPHVEKRVERMIGCTGSVGRGLCLQPIPPRECASLLRSRERAASFSTRGLSLIDLRSASGGTTSKRNGFQESRAFHN